MRWYGKLGNPDEEKYQGSDGLLVYRVIWTSLGVGLSSPASQFNPRSILRGGIARADKDHSVESCHH
jgi:hypothetical protein